MTLLANTYDIDRPIVNAVYGELLHGRSTLPSDLTSLSDVDTCPVEVLPFLALKYGALAWSDLFGEHYQRASIKYNYLFVRFLQDEYILELFVQKLWPGNYTRKVPRDAITGAPLGLEIELSEPAGLTLTPARVADVTNIIENFFPNTPGYLKISFASQFISRIPYRAVFFQTLHYQV